MKSPSYQFGKILGTLALGGFLITSLPLAAQDANKPPGTPAPTPPREQRDRGKTDKPSAARRAQPMMLKLADLVRDGKIEEAKQLAEKMHAAAANNPRIAGMLGRAEGKWQPKPQNAQRWMAPPTTAAGPPLPLTIQHLREATKHLLAAGCEQLANLTRMELGRIEGAARHQAESKRSQYNRRPDNDARRPDTDSRRPDAPDARRPDAPDARRPDAPDANAAIMAELEKIRREMADMRNQISHLKGESSPKRFPERPMFPMQ